MLEAEGHERDCAAVWGVAKNRATLPAFRGQGPVVAMVEYSRLYRRRSARARAIARMPFGPMPDATKWERLMRLAERIVAGEVPDPCRGKAWHFRGRNDPHPPSMRVIRCGDTRNVFLAYRRVR